MHWKWENSCGARNRYLSRSISDSQNEEINISILRRSLNSNNSINVKLSKRQHSKTANSCIPILFRHYINVQICFPRNHPKSSFSGLRSLPRSIFTAAPRSQSTFSGWNRSHLKARSRGTRTEFITVNYRVSDQICYQNLSIALFHQLFKENTSQLLPSSP